MRVFLSFFVLSLFLSCASLAPKPKPAVRPSFGASWEKACSEERRKFCQTWTEKEGTRMDCLARAEKELSGGCYLALREAAPPCVFDRARWCSQFKPSEARVWGCLSEHGKQVSLSCRSFRSEVVTREKTLRKACGTDTDRYCSAEGGSPWRCLRENLNRVSSPCRSEMARGVKGKGKSSAG